LFGNANRVLRFVGGTRRRPDVVAARRGDDIGHGDRIDETDPPIARDPPAEGPGVAPMPSTRISSNVNRVSRCLIRSIMLSRRWDGLARP
jgi:hypothetical protein